jgi:predicted transcriptional regulator
MVPKRGRSSGSLEREIIACLATADGPMTPAEVQAELGGDLAYTTVMTTLSRLHTKRALIRSPRGRAFAYELVGGTAGAQASVTAHQMHKLLTSGLDRAGVLAHFVESLDGDTERLLRELLDESDKPPVS